MATSNHEHENMESLKLRISWVPAFMEVDKAAGTIHRTIQD
jgi:hypothetical protein